MEGAKFSFDQMARACGRGFGFQIGQTPNP
jgi:hypothetical protein